MKNIARWALAGFTLAAASAMAQQQFANADEAIKFRKSTLKEMQQNFKRVADMATGKASYDAKLAEDSAFKAAELIQKPWVGFGPGTEGGKAKPEIWKEEAKFKELAQKSQDQMAKLAAAAKTGSLDNIKTALGPTGASCKACHDAFRAE